MKLNIKKIQKIVDDKPEEAEYFVSLDREYKADFRSDSSLISTYFYEDELKELAKKIIDLIATHTKQTQIDLLEELIKEIPHNNTHYSVLTTKLNSLRGSEK